MSKRKKTCTMQFNGVVTPIITTVGKRVRNAREEAGMSQERLAQEIGLSRISLSHIETGRRKQVKPDIISKVAKVLRKPEGYFYNAIASPSWHMEGDTTNTDIIVTPVNWIGLSSSIRDILIKLSTLSHPQQEQLGQLITQLLTWYETEIVGEKNE